MLRLYNQEFQPRTALAVYAVPTGFRLAPPGDKYLHELDSEEEFSV
ncbi:hypothetical protein [Salmonirosea aquatica]